MKDAGVDHPETRYAWNGDVALAYQVIGEGGIDLLYLQGWTSNVDLNWDSPFLASFLRGLSTHGRLILTDRRGWGCSDRFSPSDVPPFDVLTDDMLAVMEAVGSERPVVFATVDCAAMAILFAATHPERVSALVLCDPFVTYVATDETPWAMTTAEWEDFFTGSIRSIRCTTGGMDPTTTPSAPGSTDTSGHRSPRADSSQSSVGSSRPTSDPCCSSSGCRP